MKYNCSCDEIHIKPKYFLFAYVLRSKVSQSYIMKVCRRRRWWFVHCSLLSIWLYTPMLDLGRFFSFFILYTVGMTPWTGNSPSQSLYLHTEQHKHRINAHRHPCLKWDSNPRPQCSSERRQFMLKTARPLWSANRCSGTWKLIPTVRGKVIPVLSELSTTPWRHMGEWMYRSTFSWPWH
jgi:hypothetical protein